MNAVTHAPTDLRTSGTAATPDHRVHLTTRGRLLALLALSALLLTAFAFGRSVSEAAVAPQARPSLGQVTVQPGDTLWGLARQTAPGQDPREVVAQLRRLNHLESAGLQAGQQLLLPTAA